MTITHEGDPPTSPPEDEAAGHKRSGVDEIVFRKAGRLQAAYLRRDPDSLAALAQLRHAINREAGDDPSVWMLTLDELPPYLRGHDDAPSAAERAVHTAMTLFAVHQQSQSTGMQRAGSSLGDAARELGRADGASEDAVRRRFVMLSTASTWEEVVHHARGLITQFRSASIPLDYGLLAADLEALQDPARAPGVRLRWGRAYHRYRRSDVDATASSDSADA